MGEPDCESLKPKVAELMKFAAVLDGHLERRNFAACGRLTIADFQLASMATYWREARMPIEEILKHRVLDRRTHAHSGLGRSLAGRTGTGMRRNLENGNGG